MGPCPRARAGRPPRAGGPGTLQQLRAPTPSSASGSGGICPEWQAQLSLSRARSGRCRSPPPPPPPSWGRRLWLWGMDGVGGTGLGLPLLQPDTPRLTPAPREHPETPSAGDMRGGGTPSPPSRARDTQGGTPSPPQGTGEGQSGSPNPSRHHPCPPPHGGDTNPGRSRDGSSQRGPRHRGRVGVLGGTGQR